MARRLMRSDIVSGIALLVSLIAMRLMLPSQPEPPTPEADWRDQCRAMGYSAEQCEERYDRFLHILSDESN